MRYATCMDCFIYSMLPFEFLESVLCYKSDSKFHNITYHPHVDKAAHYAQNRFRCVYSMPKIHMCHWLMHQTTYLGSTKLLDCFCLFNKSPNFPFSWPLNLVFLTNLHNVFKSFNVAFPTHIIYFGSNNYSQFSIFAEQTWNSHIWRRLLLESS